MFVYERKTADMLRNAIVYTILNNVHCTYSVSFAYHFDILLNLTQAIPTDIYFFLNSRNLQTTCID